jgi:hypothetical protein
VVSFVFLRDERETERDERNERETTERDERERGAGNYTWGENSF